VDTFTLPGTKGQHPSVNLSTPIIVNRFFRNRKHDVVTTRIGQFKNIPMIDIRVWRGNASGCMVPTKLGISMKLSRLRDLKRAIDKAVDQAERLGLLPRELP
jgi:hypothetical protein